MRPFLPLESVRCSAIGAAPLAEHRADCRSAPRCGIFSSHSFRTRNAASFLLPPTGAPSISGNTSMTNPIQPEAAPATMPPRTRQRLPLGVDIRASSIPGADEILSPEALDFLTRLVREFEPTRRQLLDRR